MNDSTDEIPMIGDFINDIWVPDIYFPTGKKGKLQDITQKNALIRIRQNGTIYLSQRYFVIVNSSTIVCV